jgi:uncharacterized protein YccT (UPF0319 family)
MEKGPILDQLAYWFNLADLATNNVFSALQQFMATVSSQRLDLD